MQKTIPQKDLALLVRDKYGGDESKITKVDCARLANDEPLAYVIGWMPFLGLKIDLSSHPLIPRPETEWWTELLIHRINERTEPTFVLDLCTGSGAIGLAILKHCPCAHVFLSDISPESHTNVLQNIGINNLDSNRCTVRTGDFFEPWRGEQFDFIAVNPPYIPSGRTLPESVTHFEPHTALFSGSDGLAHTRRIYADISAYMRPGGESWLECDSEHAGEALQLATEHGTTRAEIRTDLYGRPRLIVGYYEHHAG